MSQTLLQLGSLTYGGGYEQRGRVTLELSSGGMVDHNFRYMSTVLELCKHYEGCRNERAKWRGLTSDPIRFC